MEKKNTNSSTARTHKKSSGLLRLPLLLFAAVEAYVWFQKASGIWSAHNVVSAVILIFGLTFAAFLVFIAFLVGEISLIEYAKTFKCLHTNKN